MTNNAYLRAVVLAAGLTAALLSTSLPAFAVDDDSSSSSVDLTSIRAKIAAKNYTAALAELRDLAEDNQQADVYNLLGFTLRKTGDLKTSLTYYTKALDLRPDFKAAREYLGELYVEMGDVAKAKDQLVALGELCPGGCEERAGLEKAIAAKAGG
ncbi:tetratricopeptide repeat protein [Methylobacterium sp. P1-11]|uniref:tetratricopeptide repeat protein n=1 Tax=Methylobacterium sp. P1-11 TaxID=2024616 RepID=UPI0011EE0CFB|nr:tetratricopeptide repeat protein [Methylobacterium sp. P1-11]KAA0122499.1 tetratricopeptide repeat protein [Methylobacterium sp. P1-11]